MIKRPNKDPSTLPQASSRVCLASGCVGTVGTPGGAPSVRLADLLFPFPVLNLGPDCPPSVASVSLSVTRALLQLVSLRHALPMAARDSTPRLTSCLRTHPMEPS